MALRWYQEDLSQGVGEVFLQGYRRILAVLPCGGGKTFTAVDICKDHKKILWLAHRKHLLCQAEQSFKASNRHDVIYHSIFADPDQSWGHFDLVVLDEAHHESCRTARQLLDKIKFNKLLGLTATPEREDNSILFFDAQVLGISMDKLIDMGFLTQPWAYTIRCHGGIVRSLTSWANNHLDIIGRTIVFTKTVEEAREFQRHLHTTSEVVHAESNKVKQLDDYQAGKTQVLLSCLILTEGTDLPCTQSIIIARNCQSKPMLTQIVGRGMRLYDGKDHCNLIEWMTYSTIKKILIKEVLRPRKRLVSSRGKDGWATRELSAV